MLCKSCACDGKASKLKQEKWKMRGLRMITMYLSIHIIICCGVNYLRSRIKKMFTWKVVNKCS